MKRTLTASIPAALALAACGGGDDEELSETDRQRVADATTTISQECVIGEELGGANLLNPPREVEEAVDSLIKIVSEHPDAEYQRPGSAESKPLVDALEETETELDDCFPTQVARFRTALTEAVQE